MRELDRLRLIGMFLAAFEQAEPQAVTYTYKERPYRIRTVSLVVGEIGTFNRGRWVPLGQQLTGQLATAVEHKPPPVVTDAMLQAFTQSYWGENASPHTWPKLRTAIEAALRAAP